MKLVNVIKYAGLSVLTEEEQELLKEILSREFEKISRLVSNDFNIMVHAKTYSKEKRRKYTLHVKLESPTKMYTSEAFGWDFKTVVHKAMNRIKTELEKSHKKSKERVPKIKRLQTYI